MCRDGRPSTETDIATVINDGVLTEGHYLDIKRQVGDTPSARQETARDLERRVTLWKLERAGHAVGRQASAAVKPPLQGGAASV